MGDERGHVTETETGYTIIRDALPGKWFYAARGPRGNLERSPFLVGKTFPHEAGIAKHLRPGGFRRKTKVFPSDEGKSSPSPSGYNAKASVQQPTAGRVQPAQSPTIVKNLVILARFSDHTTLFSRDDFDAQFNERGYSTDGAYGSVADYYAEASHGHVAIDSTVADWVVLPHEEAYYGADDANGNDIRRQEMAVDAIGALDDTGFDFSPFDSNGDGYIDLLTIVHSGLGQECTANPDECMWSHMRTLFPRVSVDGIIISQYCTAPERRYNTASIARIGTVCHEIGHLFDLPDLYDTDFSSAGIAVWGVMGAGSWGGNGASPERPVHFCAWSKMKLGWLRPTEIDGSDSPVTVPQIEETLSPAAYKISCEMGDGEYLLIENRQQRSYDAKLPSGGLLIWHIDDNKPDNDDEEDHYMVGLLQADGRRDLEGSFGWGDAGDPFPGSSGNRSLTPDSSPNSDSYFNGDTHISITNICDPADEMSFLLSTLLDVYSEDFSGGLPAGWTVIDGYDDGYTWTNQNPGSRTNSNWSGVFMIADSAWAGLRWMDEELISPVFDCSEHVHTRIQFSHCFRARDQQTGDVDIRIGGGEWQNVARYVSASDQGRRSIDLSSYADGRSSVQIRWHFHNARFDWYWGVDDVVLRGLPPVNEPPEVSINAISQRRDGSGHLEVAFTGRDAENDPATWVASGCQFAAYPYSEWQPLSFDTADPAHTAQEPMAFTAAGTSFVAVIDALSWHGSYKVKLRVSDGASESLSASSDEFAVDNAAPELSAATHLENETPQSGDSAATAGSSWSDPNLDKTWFSLKINDGGWSAPIAGAPAGKSAQSATFEPVVIDGDDSVTVKSYHVDDFGNQSEESVSSPYYVTPLVPSAPQVGMPTPNSLVVVVVPNPEERADVDYAVSCLTVEKHVDYATGTFVDSPVWGKRAEWNGDAGVTVRGLSSKTLYSFAAMAANPLDHQAKSAWGPGASGTTANTPPNPPQAVQVSPESPVTTDDLCCSVTAADPPDADVGDVVSYVYTWSNGQGTVVVVGPAEALINTLPASVTRKGETWTCTVEAYDGEAYSSGIADGVSIGNSLPTLEVMGETTVYPFSPVSLNVEAYDADDDFLTLTCEGVPEGAAFTDAGDGTGTFGWVPSSAGTYPVTFVADDGEDRTSLPVSIHVAPTEFRIVYINLEPVLGERQVLSITWFGIPGALYSVFRSADLIIWECVGAEIALPTGSEQGDWLSYSEDISGRRFHYRVGME